MKLNGNYTFKAPPDQVWAVLLDPDALGHCLPGCEGLALIGPDEYEATVTLGIAAIKGTYKGKVKIVDQDPPNSYRMEMEGKGGPGHVKGSAVMRLEVVGDETKVHYEGDAQVGGAIASVGQRMMAPVARQILGRFFKCLDERLQSGQAAGEQAAATSAPGEGQSMS